MSAVFDQYGAMRPAFDLKNPDGTTWNASTPSPEPALKISDASGNRIDPLTLAVKRSAPLLDSNNSIYFRGAGYADVAYYKNFRAGDTFYVRHGDWFVGLCFANLAYLPLRRIFGRKKVLRKN